MQKNNLKSNLKIKNIKFLRDTFIDTLFKRAQKDKKNKEYFLERFGTMFWHHFEFLEVC